MAIRTYGSNGQSILPDFQKYLSQKSLAPANRISYLAHWVCRYLSYANDREIDATQYNEIAILGFMEVLRRDRVLQDWQVKQADEALKLYYLHYHGQKKGNEIAPEVSNASELTAEMIRIIRLKHYSYSTESTYIQWVERFAAHIKKSGKELDSANADDLKLFLSHLALKRRVSSSTQNQAFNALLFMFRHVLKRPVDGIETAVRAKRGPKLPVVLNVDEVKLLFDNDDLHSCFKRLVECSPKPSRYVISHRQAISS